MKVEVRLYAMLRKWGPPDGGPLTLELAEGERVAKVTAILGMPQEEELVILINGRPAGLQSVLADGDRLVLFPPVTGG